MSEKPTEAGGLPKRWSARRKLEVVLRLLRGEDIGEVSREIRVPPPELERWRRMLLEGTCEGLKTKNAPDGELMRTRAKLGEMTMRVELQAELLEKRGYGEELWKLLRPWYESVSEMQEDLDAYMENYNRNRPHRGRGMEGLPPLSGLQEGDPEAQDPEEVNQKGGEDRSLKR